MTAHTRSELAIFATCPQSKDFQTDIYLRHVTDVARWSEEAGCTGILVYTDNGLVDPWLAAQAIIHSTKTLCPLVAVQPIYMHPYAVAKMVASIAHLHRRRVCLNMVAGGFRGDLLALGDPTPHDDRYARLTEYTLIIKALLSNPQPVTFEGRYYTIRNLRLAPHLPLEFMPEILMSGSSSAALAAVRDTSAVGIIYPEPIDRQSEPLETIVCRGARFGIIARQSAAEAWEIAHTRFPPDDRGRLTHKLTMTVSDSTWHQQLSAVPDHAEGGTSPYWLWPFQTYKTFCPYLIGSFEQVAEYVAHYLASGYRTFILDIPQEPEDLQCAATVFRMAMSGSTAAARPQGERLVLP